MYQTKYDEKAKEWRGFDLPPLYNPKVSLAQVLLDALTIYRSKIAQVIFEKKKICVINFQTCSFFKDK